MGKSLALLSTAIVLAAAPASATASITGPGGSEVSNLPALVEPTATVPEPGTWAMLIAGFGFVGAALRRRRTITA